MSSLSWLSGLTFGTLREANLRRAPSFKNNKGELSHPNGVTDWTPEQWYTALSGEVGELGNFMKKNFRGDIDDKTFKENAQKELADIQIYLDLLAARLGVDLGKVTIDKFNEVSERVGSNVKIMENGYDYRLDPAPGNGQS